MPTPEFNWTAELLWCDRVCVCVCEGGGGAMQAPLRHAHLGGPGRRVYLAMNGKEIRLATNSSN